jgi:hypothetical protein
MRTQAVPIVEAKWHAYPPCDRKQMDDGVGRAPDGSIIKDRVLHRLSRQDLGHAKIFVHHLHDSPPCQLGQGIAAGIYGRNGGIPRQAHAQAFDHARHARCSTHRHAVPFGTIHATFGLEEFTERHLAGIYLLDHLENARSRAELAAAKLAVQHRSAGEANRRQIARSRSHQQRRSGFIASHQKNHSIDWVPPNGLFHVHAGEVAEKHGGRTEL